MPKETTKQEFKKEDGRRAFDMTLTQNDLKAIETLLLPIHGRLDGVDGRLDSVENRLDRVESRLDGVESRLDGVESRLDKTDLRLDKLESEVSALKYGQLDIVKELKNVNRKISDTYDLALDAWGTGVENRNWLEQL